MNLKDVSETLYLNSKHGCIAILNFAENEWTSATDISGGANPIEINIKQINIARKG